MGYWFIIMLVELWDNIQASKITLPPPLNYGLAKEFKSCLTPQLKWGGLMFFFFASYASPQLTGIT